ncbi:MAG: helix-turn-helix domain-containing protein [Thaumarchaeota archaeon]|nr:helix-turn-helix domain-containing protein [Candidatus Calditenuaceae archaeon]MCX8203717.1 helix-turn-helix domain-containing protein [Nitrososphaeria archaeon]MDW8043153.1 helix-turn-helix domain-containing protein [Nitrososphaerota archaeon]
MLRVRARMLIACPWAQRLRALGSSCELVMCVPKVKSLGVSALVKVKSAALSAGELSEKVSAVPGVEHAVFFEGVEAGSYVGLVRTKACACARSGVPFNRLLTAKETAGGVTFELLFQDPNEFSDFVRESNARGYSVSVEEVKQVAAEQPATQLTKTQMQLLAAALHMGFYEVPKKAGTRELAELFGTSPRAISEVIRRAHKKLVSSTISAAERT